LTISWTEWLLEKGEQDSRSYDFIEARPVWTMWGFRSSVAAVCICLVWFFWPFAWDRTEQEVTYFRSEGSGDNFVTCDCAYDTGEYPGFCVITGVMTTDRFLQWLQAASRDTL
jgi:hypothetical protein